jgi:organic radical activating enzyme
MKRIIEKLEFYITNVCNLNCANCNRFNNHNFAGWQRWSDYANDYAEWAKYIQLKKIVILGGEPLLNPNLNEWIVGLNKYFDCPIQILTNGTRLNYVPGFYELLKSNTMRYWAGISLHNINDLSQYIDSIRLFLKSPVVEYSKSTPNVPINMIQDADYVFVDQNNVTIRVWIQDQFYQASIYQTPATWENNQLIPGRFTLHNNDPFFAHQACGFANWKNYHMIKGKLYKCGPVALMPEFDDQHVLDISDDDRKLLHGYQPLSAWDYPTKGHEFFKALDHQLSQCKFCPVAEQMQTQQIFAVQKKKNSTSSIG